MDYIPDQIGRSRGIGLTGEADVRQFLNAHKIPSEIGRVEHASGTVAGPRIRSLSPRGIVKLSRIRLTDPQDDALESRREPGMLGVDHRDSA